MKIRRLRLFIMTAMFAAMIMLTTAYVLHIPVGIGGGYVHLGDTVIYIAASVLPTPFAALSAALGGALADVLVGATTWALPTAIIKAVMVLPFTYKRERLFCTRNVLATVIAGVIGVCGYFIAEIGIVLLSGSTFAAGLTGSLAAVLPNVAQEFAGAVAFCLIALALDRLKIKNQLSKML